MPTRQSTVQVHVNTLSGVALDWAVAKCLGVHVVVGINAQCLWHVRGSDEPWGAQITYLNWAKGGPIIDGIQGFELKCWLESKPESRCEAHIHNHAGDWIAFGPLPLVAALRVYVASTLGEVVEIPVELVA
ncbi:hypothetical protein PuT2_15535 [Pusillimonas sp. T2]|uniref:phage protein NinX family protein n=1 Tax=Pusillimonas sp. T2 TaxID=1548123 RepID=UPI000B8B3B0D|nr:phage protein NinX family protein [Pusillimonas sp. T2]OXR47882.1 hypothetical protein PuT2_15535 [Pusillimonas sp. T2]